jgi:hypothetical protein
VTVLEAKVIWVKEDGTTVASKTSSFLHMVAGCDFGQSLSRMWGPAEDLEIKDILLLVAGSWEVGPVALGSSDGGNEEMLREAEEEAGEVVEELLLPLAEGAGSIAGLLAGCIRWATSFICFSASSAPSLSLQNIRQVHVRFMYL